MHGRELLVDTLAHSPPKQTLEALSPEDADRRLSGVNHSIAEIVAHVSFWQNWFCQRCDGIREPLPQTAAPGWPPVAAGSWPDVHARFLAGLDRASTLGEGKRRLDDLITPAIEFPPLANYTIRDALVHIANHNAHHLGQIILLRQAMGLWPPPAGSYTW